MTLMQGQKAYLHEQLCFSSGAVVRDNKMKGSEAMLRVEKLLVG